MLWLGLGLGARVRVQLRVRLTVRLTLPLTRAPTLEQVGFVLWSPDGTRLISGDARPSGGGQHEKAVLGVWKVDNRGRFSTICTYRRAATGEP